MANHDLPRIRKESGIFSVEIDKIRPNSMQPRRVFDDTSLKELSDSIRQYGILQPLVVSRQETEVPDGAFVQYEIIAGERRWRAAKMANLSQVPVIIREEPSEKVKLELALIENIQREDLTPLDRAEAFHQLVNEFKMRHHEVGVKVGKSREYVSNTVRLLSLPDEIKEGLRQGLIAEGHTRPLLSLTKQVEDQISLYKEIIYRKMTVREAEDISRKLVRERTVRRIKDEREDPEAQRLERQLADALGTRVYVERRGPAKKISIEFFSEEELMKFLSKMGIEGQAEILPEEVSPEEVSPEEVSPEEISDILPEAVAEEIRAEIAEEQIQEKQEEEEDWAANFTI